MIIAVFLFRKLKNNFEKNIFSLVVLRFLEVKIPSSLYRQYPILFVKQQ